MDGCSEWPRNNLGMAKTEIEKGTIHHRFVTFSSASTLHGIRNVGETRFSIIKRVTWLLLLLLMLAILLYFFINGMTTYLSYPTTTKLNVYENASLIYPAVTICNNNQLQRRYLRSNPLVDDYFGSKSHLFPQLTTVNTSDPEVLDSLDNIYVADVFKDGAHGMKHMFTFCTWNYQFIQCSEEFTTFLTERHGLCYTFNWNGSYITENSGELYGLAVALYLDQDNYDHTATSPGAGLHLHLHSPGSYPLFTTGVTAIPPGVVTDIKINKYKDVLLPLPYEGPGCYDGEDYDNLDECKFKCRFAYFENSCNCTLLPELKKNDYDNCTIKDYIVCLGEKTATYTTDNTILESCGCMHHCEEVTYGITQSSLLFPSSYATQYYNEHMGLTFTDDTYRNNVVYLKIYYENLLTTVTEQTPSYTFATFSAEIGGYMGLFLGASLLTISELLEFVGTLLFSLCHRVNQIDTERDAWPEKNQKMVKSALHY